MTELERRAVNAYRREQRRRRKERIARGEPAALPVGRPPQPRVPFAPLLHASGEPSLTRFAARAGIPRRSARCWYDLGLTLSSALHAARELNLDPVAVWGDTWPLVAS